MRAFLTAGRLERRLAFRLALAGLVLALAAGADRAAAVSPRVVAIADIHGALDEFRDILQATGLVDAGDVWTGRDAVLVQTGDYLDRGTDVRAVMDLLMTLEREAPRTGGRVLVLLGNHETMNLIGETRDVNPAVYATFADGDSEKRRQQAWNDYEKLANARAKALGSRPAVFDVKRKAWMAAHPPGMIEYLAALGPDGTYGKWLRQRPVVVDVEGTAFMHAGLDPESAPDTLEDVNAQVHRDIEAFDGFRQYLVEHGIILPFFTLQEIVAAVQAEADAITAATMMARAGSTLAAERLESVEPELLDSLRGVVRLGRSSLIAPDGPMWFRGFATWTDAEGPERIQVLLDRYHVKRFVTGHSVQRPSDVNGRFGGRVFLIDTGMLSSTYVGGRASALEISGDTVTAVYADSTRVLAGPGK